MNTVFQIAAHHNAEEYTTLMLTDIALILYKNSTSSTSQYSQFSDQDCQNKAFKAGSRNSFPH